MLRYLRIRLLQRLLAVAQPIARRARMKRLSVFDLKPGQRVIDLGGTSEIWKLYDTPLDITIVNLPGVDVVREKNSHHSFSYVEGDATNLHQYADNSFDLVFSNSVIEHVGGPEKERAFAREVRRLAPAYYVQTPSVWFPLEAHTGVPLWWALPAAARQRLIKRWKRKLPAWTEMIEGTTVISRATLQRYFPDGTLVTERIAGMPKSYSIYRKAAQQREPALSAASAG